MTNGQMFSLKSINDGLALIPGEKFHRPFLARITARRSHLLCPF
jgi:hypothetical protein